MLDFECSASFIISFVGNIDADITLLGVELSQRDYYADSIYDFIVRFSYVTGIPKADRFSFNSPDGLTSQFYSFEPSVPEGVGSEVRMGTLTGSARPPFRELYNGEITIHQVDADPELPQVSEFIVTTDETNNRISVAWGVPSGSALSLALTLTETATLAYYEYRLGLEGEQPAAWSTKAIEDALVQIDDGTLGDLLQASGIPEDTRVTVVLDVRAIWEVTNSLVPASSQPNLPPSIGPYWTGGNNGTYQIFNADGSRFRVCPYGTDVQRLLSGSTLFIEPDGTRIKVPPSGVTRELRHHGGIRKNTWQFPVDVWRPSVVQNLKVINVGRRSLRLTWDRPADTGNSIITGYEIRYKRREDISYNEPVIYAATSREREYSNLSDGTYDFAIRATNGGGRFSRTTYAVGIVTPT